MSFLQVISLITYAVGMMCGQLLFKAAANSAAVAMALTFKGKIAALIINPFFVLAMCLYLAMSLFWVWILTQMALSKAYPFIAVNFIMTAAASILVYGERISPTNGIGLVLIAMGVVLVAQ